MSQPMLTVAAGAQAEPTEKASLHLLPCRVHHDGDVEGAASFWHPTDGPDGMKTAYLRGRKLHGKAVKLPGGYYGSVAERGDTRREIPREEELDASADVEEVPEPVEVAPLQAKAHFDEFVVWGHESTADASTDPYVRSIEEWVSFAEQIHAYPSSESSSK